MHQPALPPRTVPTRTQPNLQPVPLVCSLLALGLGAALAPAQTPSALISAGAGTPLDFIPGQPGVPISSFTQATLRLSRTGRFYALAVNATSQPSSSDNYLLVGTAQGIQYSIAESAPLPGIGFGYLSRPDTPIGINDLGDVAFSGQTTNPAANANDGVFRFDRSANLWATVALENQAIPGLAGEIFSPLMDWVTLLDDGRVAFLDTSTSGALPSSQDELLFLAQPGAPAYSILAQAGVTLPTGQAGGTTAFLSDLFRATVSADGLHYLADAALAGVPAGTGRVVVVDGAVVHQQGQSVPGLTGVVTSTFPDAEMFPGGDWAVLSGTTTGDSYLLVNGVYRLKEGDPVPGGQAGEVVQTLRHVDINRWGDIAVHVDTNLRGVVLFLPSDPQLPGRVVFASATGIPPFTGTRVDLNGDCVLNDDAYLVFLNDDTTGIDDQGRIYLIGRLANGAGLTEGDALFSVRGSGQTPLDCDGNGRRDDCEIGKNPLLDQNLDGLLDSCFGQTLSVNQLLISASEGGQQNFNLSAGAGFAGQFYLLLGSASGTAPGLPLGSVVLPLNPDAYTSFTLGGGAPVFSGSIGLLNAAGNASAALTLAPGALSSTQIGLTLFHAALVFDGVNFTLASNPVAFLLGA
jgi:hypothetical protein